MLVDSLFAQVSFDSWPSWTNTDVQKDARKGKWDISPVTDPSAVFVLV